MKIQDRYASAVHSSDLKSEAKTRQSDSDVLGAYGLAGKRAPLATALERLFTGDNGAAREIVQIMAQMLRDRSKALKLRLTLVQAEDMARAVLAWHRDGKCKPCGGHGYEIVPGTRTVGDTECRHCKGTTMIPFEKQFRPEHRILARWLQTHVEKEQAVAGPEAMKSLAPRLDL